MQGFKKEYDPGQFNFEKGVMKLNGAAKSVQDLKDYVEPTKPEKFDQVLLQVLFSIVLFNVNGIDIVKVNANEIISVYYPDLVRMQGGASNVGKDDYDIFREKIRNFNSVVGVIDNEIYPLMTNLTDIV